MTGSLQKKILGVCILLVLVTAGSISLTYYLLARDYMRWESRQRVQIAFDIILNDLRDHLDTSVKRAKEFSSDETLQVTTSLYQRDEERIRSISYVSTNLAKAADEIRRFGRVNVVQRVRLYGANARLLAAYLRDNGQESIGVYVALQDGTDVYLPADDPSQLTPMLLGREPIPELALPDELAVQYAGEIPVLVSAQLFTENSKLGVRIIAPIADQEQTTGVLIVELFYTQSIVEHYAMLSKTEVNFFVHDTFSAGTLPVQSTFTPRTGEDDLFCNDIMDGEGEISVFSATINEQEYYQGQCLLREEQDTIGAITASFSQEFEERQTSRMLTVVLAVAGLAVIAAVVLSLILSRKPVRSIRSVMAVIAAVAEGNLRQTAVVISRDEFGALATHLNRMIEQLRTMVGQVQRAGFQVTSSTTELSAMARQQEATITTQVESTNHVLQSVENISHLTAELVETMQQVTEMSQETAQFASSGQTDLTRMQDAMQRMEDASTSISGRLQAINEKAENITSVVTTITKVADQTNLLSLNAAIEAEKAGEYGRGFTVVASEIRRLADQTAVATLDIEQMVEEMQSAMAAGVTEMDTFIEEVRHSAEDVEKISLQLARIIEQVQALSPRFEDVNAAMGHQSESAQQITTAMMNLSEEMQQTSASLRESFLAIGQLNEAARSLQDEVSRFKMEKEDES